MGGQDPENVRPAVTSGQDVLRSLILSGEGRRRFFIHPRCTRTGRPLRTTAPPSWPKVACAFAACSESWVAVLHA